MKICVNGMIVEDREANVSVYDHGFLYGIGLFETFRTYGGQPFLLDRHGKRLEHGCRTLGINYRFCERTIREAVRELLTTNRLSDAYFRLSVSAGQAPLGLAYDDYEQPNWILYIKQLPPTLSDPTDLANSGKILRCLHIRRDVPEADIRLKSFQFINNALAAKELARYYQRTDPVEGLFLTSDGYVAEGTVSNVFFANQNQLFTPSLETGILPGITRSFVIELAKKCGFSVIEGLFTWEQLEDADEVFLTNSIQEIIPVTTLIDVKGKRRIINDGQAGKLTLKLMKKYKLATKRMNGI